jgi:VWFA-related protein
MRRVVATALAGLACLLATVPGQGLSARAAVQGRAVTPGQTAVVDVAVLDAGGQPVSGLRPSDFAVSVDGVPREVLGARYVYRGPGAAASAAQAADLHRATRPAAQISRVVLVVVDEGSLMGGDERSVRSLVARLVDRLGPEDEITVVPLPGRGEPPSPTTDREVAFQALKTLAGRAVPAGVSGAAFVPPNPVSVPVDPDKTEDRAALAARESEARRAAAEAALSEPASPSRYLVPSPLSLLNSLLSHAVPTPGPGRLILVSAGLPDLPGSSTIEQVVGAAAAARLTIDVLYRRVSGWMRPMAEAGFQTDAAAGRPAGVGGGSARTVADQGTALVYLAAATGGTLVEVGRNADQAIERLISSLGGAFLVTVRTTETDWDGNVHNLRVSVKGAGVSVVRARQRWMPRDEPELTGAEPEPVVAAAPTPLLVPLNVAPSGDTARVAGGEGPARTDPALAILLASVAEYLAAYERNLSAIVAEEKYVQEAHYPPSAGSSLRRVRVELQSDFLMVQPPGGGAWIPFRDVFAVDGNAVRDREDRLKNLFLEKPATAMSEAQRITDEGARYNVGPVTRNVNVPTFPLAFLKASNQRRFAITKHGEESIDGLRIWRVDYVERASPTFIQTGIGGQDVPVTGSFWIDPVNGRIVKTSIKSAGGTVAMEATVVYRPNDTLGVWVPAGMKEKYDAGGVVVEAEASYSNFRRFRVQTEEQIRIPKHP